MCIYRNKRFLRTMDMTIFSSEMQGNPLYPFPSFLQISLGSRACICILHRPDVNQSVFFYGYCMETHHTLYSNVSFAHDSSNSVSCSSIYLFFFVQCFLRDIRHRSWYMKGKPRKKRRKAPIRLFVLSYISPIRLPCHQRLRTIITLYHTGI